jgi:hypothetical protein
VDVRLMCMPIKTRKPGVEEPQNTYHQAQALESRERRLCRPSGALRIDLHTHRRPSTTRNPKHEIPNKFQIPHSNDQNGPAAIVVAKQLRCVDRRRPGRIEPASYLCDGWNPRVLNFGPSNLVLVWNFVLEIWNFAPPAPCRSAMGRYLVPVIGWIV